MLYCSHSTGCAEHVIQTAVRYLYLKIRAQLGTVEQLAIAFEINSVVVSDFLPKVTGVENRGILFGRLCIRMHYSKRNE
jgi:hypothetical protein